MPQCVARERTISEHFVVDAGFYKRGGRSTFRVLEVLPEGRFRGDSNLFKKERRDRGGSVCSECEESQSGTEEWELVHHHLQGEGEDEISQIRFEEGLLQGGTEAGISCS